MKTVRDFVEFHHHLSTVRDQPQDLSTGYTNQDSPTPAEHLHMLLPIKYYNLADLIRFLATVL